MFRLLIEISISTCLYFFVVLLLYVYSSSYSSIRRVCLCVYAYRSHMILSFFSDFPLIFDNEFLNIGKRYFHFVLLDVTMLYWDLIITKKVFILIINKIIMINDKI